MQDKQRLQLGFVQSTLPWIVAGGALLLYALTLNRWVSLASLPFVAVVAGWDVTLPAQAPVFFTLTYPIRWLPAAWQPIALNVFAAISSALTLALLVRSVALLPHDRTHAQRQRERSEFSLLSIPGAWLPPLFAALVCGLQLTFWEHSVAATNEALDLVFFAYVIRCLLEYRISQKESWLTRMALVYGIGLTNNYAMIAYIPGFLVALIWIRGRAFFQLRFLLKMAGFALAGLCFYLVLPTVLTLFTDVSLTFWDILKSHLGLQKAYLLDVPALRNRVLVLSLTSVLPVLIMGIRWPSSFGDTSAAGAILTNLMFRAIHIVLLAACLWVAFDQKFSPRALGLGFPFLTFYYLGALSIGYFSGYVLLVFGESKGRSWRRRSSGTLLIDRAVAGAVWLAAIAVPAGLVYKNFPLIRNNDGRVLWTLAELSSKSLPAADTVVLSDDATVLRLLQGYLSGERPPGRRLLVHTRSLALPDYHRQLLDRYPNRWPNILKEEMEGARIDDATLLNLLVTLSEKNALCYLHPSFGFYFEQFYPRPDGLLMQLKSYEPEALAPPRLSPDDLERNQKFWNSIRDSLKQLSALAEHESLDALFASVHYSRALNLWGVEMQKENRLDEAAQHFALAVELNTNNVPALVNAEYNKTLRTGQSTTNEIVRIMDEKYTLYSSLETVLAHNGPIDHPEFCYRFGQLLVQQNLYRQAAIQFSRVASLEPTNRLAQIALAGVYLQRQSPDLALQEAERIKNSGPLAADAELALLRLQAAAHFAKTNHAAAEQVLLDAQKKFPDNPSVLETLVMLYGQTGRTDEALAVTGKLLQLSPDDPKALINQATLYFNSKRFDEAIQSLDRALQKNPKNLQALLYKVFMFTETKKYDEAQAQVQRILDLDPDNPEGLLYEGGILIEKQKFSEALKPLHRLLKLQPANVHGLRNRAIAYLRMGQLDDARKDYEKLRQQAPTYYIPYYGLGEIAYQRKDKAAAIKNYELYLKYVPDGPELADERKMIGDRLRELKGAGG